MNLLFPDMYKRLGIRRTAEPKGIQPKTDAVAVKAKHNFIVNSRPVYMASSSYGLYCILLIKHSPQAALGLGNGWVNLHETKSCKKIYGLQVRQ